jgi:AraC family transcriptional regulator, regulatory protein of adaptative response / DNA-3-methyladenine glycosylase II
VRLALTPPVDVEGLLRFLGNRAIPGVEHVADGRYGRTLALPHGPGTVWLRPDGDGADVELRLTDGRDADAALAAARRLLDAEADPAAINEVLGADPVLAPLVAATPGIRLPGAVDGPELALRAVFGQQISVAAARHAAGRLAEALGEPLPTPDGPLTRLFPTPAAIAERGAEVLTGPRRRTATILTLCAAMASGDLVVRADRDADELGRELCALPGIGPWTAGYVAMRVLRATDVLLSTDLVVRRGAEALGLTALEEHARRWRPWRSYACMHLWRAAPARARPPTGNTHA